MPGGFLVISGGMDWRVHRAFACVGERGFVLSVGTFEPTSTSCHLKTGILGGG